MDGRVSLSGTASLVVKTLDFGVEGTGFEPRGGPIVYVEFQGGFCTDVHQATLMSTRNE